MDQRSKIAILGFGVEGKAMMDYLVRNGYGEVTVCDRNVNLEEEMPQGVSVRLGEEVYLKGLEDFEVIFRSPGIPFLLPEIQSVMARGVEVSSAIQYFMEQCPCPVVGVTGTKGKGTTSSLIYEMLKQGGRMAGVDLFLGGNIGKCPMEFFEQLKGSSLVVLELSSFQLQGLKISPKYAVLLNTTSDHLDYHVDNDEYMQAKESLLAHQHADGVAVLNRDYEYVKFYEPLVKGSLLEVSVRGRGGMGSGVAVEERGEEQERERGEEQERERGEEQERERGREGKEQAPAGAYVANGGIYYVKERKFEKMADVSEVALIGSHNLENILPAVVIAKELGVSAEAIGEVIRTFKNLPHRLQFVRELKGVRYYNDSYSTNDMTSMAAVDSFEEPLVLIAGGSDKGLDYSEWAEKILTRANLHTVILMGQTTEKMEKALMAAEERLGEAVLVPTKILRRGTLEHAVVDAYAESDEGGVVVMSPAAASFDMFKDYKERGNEFVAQVRKLK